MAINIDISEKKGFSRTVCALQQLDMFMLRQVNPQRISRLDVLRNDPELAVRAIPGDRRNRPNFIGDDRQESVIETGRSKTCVQRCGSDLRRICRFQYTPRVEMFSLYCKVSRRIAERLNGVHI